MCLLSIDTHTLTLRFNQFCSSLTRNMIDNLFDIYMYPTRTAEVTIFALYSGKCLDRDFHYTLYCCFFLVLLLFAGYLFLRPKKKDIDSLSEEIAAKSDSAAAASVTMAKPAPSAVVAEPVVIKAREPIPEKQQRELFKWILEEKRKLKPRNAEEKKRIDQEKAILKQFIGSKTIPTL
ncbi:uncharacterized protein LOC125609474 isoform X1 [Brassica napus]|uniref:uncharacterized protein LOC125609474 isoform X1 n=1 Tax=Brassica napus TaxID=3708 RepID=UPI0020790854|nr:uncharacterized protein LOC125609474 isoform X1 [Brassica napus]